VLINNSECTMSEHLDYNDANNGNISDSNSDTDSDNNDDNIRCFICLCNKGERAPYCSKRESDDFIKPCKCSFVAHRKCFLSWVSSITIPKVIGPDPDRSTFGIPVPFARSTNPQALTFHCSIFELLTGTFSLSSDKMCVLVDCPQCRRRICLSTKNNWLLNIRRFCEQVIDSLGSAALLSGTISTACLSIIASAMFTLGSLGQDTLNILAKPSVQLGIYGVRRFPSLSISDALDNDLISSQRYASITCGIPLYTLYLTSSFPFGYQADFLFSVLAYSLFSDPDGVPDTVPRRIMRNLTIARALAKAVYNISLNKIYYYWHKTIQPCFFTDKLSQEDLIRIEEDIEEDNEQTSRDEVAATKDSRYPFLFRVLRKTFRYFTKSLKTWWRELFICSKVDFSVMFGSSSMYRKVLVSLFLPRVGKYISDNLLVSIPGMNTFLNRFTDTPDENLFLRNILGCATASLISTVLSFALNYFRYRQLRHIDVDDSSTEYLKYVNKVYGEDGTQQ